MVQSWFIIGAQSVYFSVSDPNVNGSALDEISMQYSGEEEPKNNVKSIFLNR